MPGAKARLPVSKSLIQFKAAGLGGGKSQLNKSFSRSDAAALSDDYPGPQLIDHSLPLPKVRSPMLRAQTVGA